MDEDIYDLRDEWVRLSGSDDPQDIARRKELLEKLDSEYEPVKESFSINDYKFGSKETHSGEELKEGCSYSSSMLDINELFEKGIVNRGDKIDLANFPDIKVIQAASQEQLDMLTPQSKDQITSVHLSNNTDMGWGYYFAQNEKPMDKSLDLTSFKNLQNIEAHWYLNSNLQEIKAPANTDHIFMQASCTPRLKRPENIDVFLNDTKTSWDTWDMWYERDFPKNHEEAEKLFDERNCRNFRIHLGNLWKENDQSAQPGEITHLVETYPDLAVKAAEALYRNTEEFEERDDFSDELSLLANHPSSIKGKTIMDVHPEVALNYYDMMAWKTDCGFSSNKEQIQFGIDHPDIIPLIEERCKKILTEHPDAIDDIAHDLAVVGAANPKFTDSVHNVLQQQEWPNLLKDMDEVIKSHGTKKDTELQKDKPEKASDQKLNVILSKIKSR